MRSIKTYKQFFENNSNLIEVVSAMYFTTDLNKSNNKVIEVEFIDKFIDIFNEVFPGSSVTLFRDDKSLWGNNAYNIHEEENDNSITIIRTDDDMVLFNYHLSTYNNTYEICFRIDYYSDDNVLVELAEKMYDFYHENFFLGVNDEGEMDDFI